MTATRGWSRRDVPTDLVERYEREGWWTDATLGGKVAEWLAAAPDTTVNIHSRTNEWHGTYADIDDEARRLIALLRSEGLEPGDVVAFQMPNSREAIVSFAALAMGGYVLVPIVHIYGRKEVAFILAECGADAYIAPPHTATSTTRRSSTRALRRAAAARGRRRVTAPTSPRPTASAASVGTSSHRSIRSSTCPLPAADEVAVLAYTSGTTSDPKGVIHDHRTMLSELAAHGRMDDRPDRT